MNTRTGRKQAFSIKLGFSEQRQGSTNHLCVGKKSKYAKYTKNPGKCEVYYKLPWQQRQNEELQRVITVWRDTKQYIQLLNKISTLVCISIWPASSLTLNFLVFSKHTVLSCLEPFVCSIPLPLESPQPCFGEAHSSLGSCSNTMCSTKPSPTSPGRAGLSLWSLCPLWLCSFLS